MTVTFVVLYLVGIFPWFGFIFVSPVIVGSLIIPPLVLANAKPGWVEIDPTTVRLQQRSYTITVPWSDIDLIELRTVNSEPDAKLYSVLGIPKTGSFVTVKLRRNLRGNLSRNRFGSSRSGIPTVINNLSLFIPDAERFAREANELRSRAVS